MKFFPLKQCLRADPVPYAAQTLVTMNPVFQRW